MKKIMILGVILLSVCISLAAVSAADDDGWSFNFSSSDSSNSNGRDVSLKNNELTIQGIKYTIPEGFEENESAQKVGEDAKGGFEGYQYSNVEFNKGEQFIYIKVIFGGNGIDDDSYTPANDTVAKKIADEDGWFTQYADSVSFDYIEDDKLIEIFAPDEKTLTDLIKSSHDNDD